MSEEQVRAAESTATTATSKRKQKPTPSSGRSTVACGSCRLRKVRCSYSTSGLPCTNCQYDGVACEILPRRKIGAKRKHFWGRPISPKPLQMRHTSATAVDRAASPESTGMLIGKSPYTPWQVDQTTTPREIEPQTTSTSPSTSQVVSNTDFSIAFDGQTSPRPDENRDLLYFGDQQGMNGMLLDLPTGSPQSSRCFAPNRLKRPLPPEDFEFLRMKGCFSIPSQHICDELISAYFQLVHPFVPVINVAQFFKSVEDGNYTGTSLLVLWSLFFAGTSFITDALIREAGYKTRMEMKLTIYRKAKHLFDLNFEEDKIAVVQAAVVLSYFYTETDDRFGSWHWLGTAISLCQTLGLHRRLDKFAPENHFTPAKLRLFRRIWWTCALRDRWLSLGQGRPMRIHMDFCDAEFPTPEDVTLELEDLPSAARERYFAADQTALARLWVDLVNLSHVLGNIIQTFYGFNTALPASEDVEGYESEILRLDSSPVGLETDRTTAFHKYVLQMFQGAAIIVLYRPYLKQRPVQTPQVEQSLRALSRTKVKAAGSQMNNVLERLIDMDAVSWLQPIWLTAVMPAMQIHLIETRQAASPLLRNISSQRLQLCMMVLAELRDNYWGADAIYRLFEQAQAAMCSPSPEVRREKGNGDSDRPPFQNQTSGDPSRSASRSQHPEAHHDPEAPLNWFDPSANFLDQFALDFLLDFDGPDRFDSVAPLFDGMDETRMPAHSGDRFSQLNMGFGREEQ